MITTKNFLSIALISVCLFSCKNTSGNQEQTEKTVTTEKTETIPEVKNDSISAGKTASEPEQKTGPAETETITNAPDTVEFSKVLTFKNIAFSVKATGKGSLQQVTIQPSGLLATNREEKLEAEPVINAEVGDLNADGYPELLIFTRSAGSGSYGKVVAFSVNNGKSMSRVTFPETSENASLKKGYGGHDKFRIVNNSLTQEFPVYKENDLNSQPSGLKKVITYKLQTGEASRIFLVENVKEIPAK